MGIHINLAAILHAVVHKHRLRGRIGTLGEQSVTFDRDALEQLNLGSPPAPRGTHNAPLRAADVFQALGFDATESMDVSDYEGATYKFDLNDADLPGHLVARFDVVLNGGTLEHVFHLANALANVTRMLRDGGTVVHVLPCNNWVDHGFYQFSPTLMFDYYPAAGFEPLESALISYAASDGGRWHVQPVLPGTLGTGFAGTLDEKIYLYVFIARRSGAVVERPIPAQNLYAGVRDGLTSTRPLRFSPYILEDGQTRELAPAARIKLQDGFVRCEGHCWQVEIPELSSVADGLDQPARPPLVLLEDERPLGPPHALHDTIRERGRGAYSHWGPVLYFSSSDNSAPDRNGRQYTAVLLDQAAARRCP